jgi:hypothetical protein
MIKLDGTLIKSDGSTEKSDFFKFLDLYPDDYSDIVYTASEAHRIRTSLQHLSTGASAALPLLCGGSAVCPFSERCPFIKLDKERKAVDPAAKSITPIGRQCLVELNLLNEWTRLYIREYEITEQNFTEYMMVRELAEIELMLWRLNNNIAKPENACLVQETVVGVDKQGNPLTRQEVTALFDAKERLQNRKSRIVKLMVGDRQEKYKKEAALKMKSEDDPSISAAKLRNQVERLLQQAQSLDIKVKEVEGNVIDAEFTSPEEKVTLTPDDLINEEE